MRAVAAPRLLLWSTSIIALAAMFAPDRAYATCTYNQPGKGIEALGTDSCTPAVGGVLQWVTSTA